MKTLASLDGGAVLLTEQAGVLTLSFDEKLSVGGGKAAGIISLQGAGSIVLSGPQALALLGAVASSHLPSGVAAVVQEGVALAEGALAQA